jgi:endonuclease/exonuclease/phosphatase family metal-dependent hydrolase
MQLTILTLNLAGYKDWAIRQPEVIKALNQVNADVVFLQEVRYDPSISPLTQANYINSLLDTPYTHNVSDVSRFYAPSVGEPYREGLATLSNYPILQSDSIVLKQAPGDEHNRIVQLLDILVGDRVLKIANVHFSLSDTVDYATAHLKETIEILSARGEERIIAGDFNISHLEALGDIWKDRYRSSTEKEYISFPEMNKRIDYFLIPRSDSFLDISVSSDELSDHRAVTADIQIV